MIWKSCCEVIHEISSGREEEREMVDRLAAGSARAGRAQDRDAEDGPLAGLRCESGRAQRAGALEHAPMDVDGARVAPKDVLDALLYPHVRLNEGDKVASMDVVQPDGFLLVVTAKGFGKRTPINNYSVQGRNTKGVSTLGRDPARAGVIAAARVVNEDDDVTIIATSGHVLRARVVNLPKSKRTSKETEVMKLKEGDAVSFEIVRGPKGEQAANVVIKS
jgi:hypothetical protein